MCQLKLDPDVPQRCFLYVALQVGAVLQATGEALYTEDIPVTEGALYAAFVCSTRAYATIKTIDASGALKMDGKTGMDDEDFCSCLFAMSLACSYQQQMLQGHAWTQNMKYVPSSCTSARLCHGTCCAGVVRFVSAADIPSCGSNDYWQHGGTAHIEPFLAKELVEYSGQALGLILATSLAVARAAAACVQVCYDDPPSPPVLTLDDAKAADSFFDTKSDAPLNKEPRKGKAISGMP